MNFTWKQLESSSSHQGDEAENGNPGGHIILAHGFGAHAGDLAPLAQNARGNARWLFPQAPVTLQPGSYAWFPSTARDMQRVFDGEYFHQLEEMSIPELGDRADQLVEDVEELGISWENTILGGFSQGSMLALRAALEHRLPLKGLILLSSSAVDRSRLSHLLDQEYRVPVFISHGNADPVLPFPGGTRLKELLESGGWDVQFREFAGGHGIPPEVETEMVGFIGDLLR